MRTLYFAAVVSRFFLSFFFSFSSPVLSCRRLDVYHTSTHDVASVRPCKFQRVSCHGSVTARQSSIERQPSFAALNRGRHLCAAGRPSRWALAHILVLKTTGRSNFTKRPHRRRTWTFNRICQVAPTCTSQCNNAFLDQPQSTSETASRSAHGRRFLYFTMDCPFSP